MMLFCYSLSYYCLGTNSTSPSGPCFAGYYCTGGSATPVQHEAEEGKYSLEGAVRAELCPLGTFQPVSHTFRAFTPCNIFIVLYSLNELYSFSVSFSILLLFYQGRGYNSCIGCQSGRLCNKTGLSQQPLCPPGHFCPAGSLIAHPCSPVSMKPHFPSIIHYRSKVFWKKYLIKNTVKM